MCMHAIEGLCICTEIINTYCVLETTSASNQRPTIKRSGCKQFSLDMLRIWPARTHLYSGLHNLLRIYEALKHGFSITFSCQMLLGKRDSCTETQNPHNGISHSADLAALLLLIRQPCSSCHAEKHRLKAEQKHLGVSF